MSHIIVSTASGTVDSQLVAALRQCLPLGVGAIAQALKDGSPLFDGELFVGSPPEQFARLRHLIGILHSAGVEPLVSEDGHPISARILLDIMQSSEESSDDFDRLDELGHRP